jgi:capsular polysaccharide export protein
VALQVYDDAALTAFGRGMTSEKLIASLAHRADMVFKIHPFERGHRHYNVPSKQNLLVYDAPMGQLLRHAKGLITINSTAALVAFSLNKPVFAFGEAFYNREGLASQQSLEDFLQNPTPPTLWPQLKSAIFETALVAGDFYAQNLRCETVQGILNKVYET